MAAQVWMLTSRELLLQGGCREPHQAKPPTQLLEDRKSHITLSHFISHVVLVLLARSRENNSFGPQICVSCSLVEGGDMGLVHIDVSWKGQDAQLSE
eukprot:6064215-Amphidinium_carterae.3